MMSIYLFVVSFFMALNALLAALSFGLAGRRVTGTRTIPFLVCAWCAAMAALFFLQAFTPFLWLPFVRHWFYLPIAVEMSWNLILLQPAVLIAILALLFRRWWAARRSRADAVTEPADPSRRRFIATVAFGAAPAVALGMGVHGSLTRFDLRVRRFAIPIAGLAPEMEGFTIAHVSDLHSGIFCGPRRLQIVSDATNDLHADLVAITGDFINHEMEEFPDALAAMRRFRSRHGNFLCEGNHDIIPGAGKVVRACRENGLAILFGSTTILSIGGKRLILAGLPWMSEGRPEMVDPLFPQRAEGDVRILLAHHPHLFDAAASADLVLAGHTHGGQLMAGDVGFGPLFFRYWSGLYRRDRTTLVVSNGCGDWFPCRVGAPAEIGLLTLTRATA